MSLPFRLALLILCLGAARAQDPPSLAATRAGMGIPSAGDLRGQQDTVGYASTAAQMAAVWELAAAPPAPERFGPAPAPGVAGAICPHDDYLYAGRVYRAVLPLVTARTVVLVGALHRYRRLGVRGRVAFEGYRAWRAPDGEIPVSSLREDLLAVLPAADLTRDPAIQDGEHSLEAIAYWLRHLRPDLEILPVLAPAADFPTLQGIATRFGDALAAAMARRGWRLGRDVAVVISSDGVHYGADFGHTPFGAGGAQPFLEAMARDRALLRGPLSGPVGAAGARAFFEAVVDPAQPDQYRNPWCGRFSIPFGQLLLARAAEALGGPVPCGVPVALGVSVDAPELPVRALGLGATAPANLHHFVSHPALAYVQGAR